MRSRYKTNFIFVTSVELPDRVRGLCTYLRCSARDLPVCAPSALPRGRVCRQISPACPGVGIGERLRLIFECYHLCFVRNVCNIDECATRHIRVFPSRGNPCNSSHLKRRNVAPGTSERGVPLRQFCNYLEQGSCTLHRVRGRSRCLLRIILHCHQREDQRRSEAVVLSTLQSDQGLGRVIALIHRAVPRQVLLGCSREHPVSVMQTNCLQLC